MSTDAFLHSAVFERTTSRFSGRWSLAVFFGLSSACSPEPDPCSYAYHEGDEFRITVTGPEDGRAPLCSPVPVEPWVGMTFSLIAGAAVAEDEPCSMRAGAGTPSSPFADIVTQCEPGIGRLALNCTLADSETSCPSSLGLRIITGIYPDSRIIENALLELSWGASVDSCPDFICNVDNYLVRIERVLPE